jgi:hypothetical protein
MVAFTVHMCGLVFLGPNVVYDIFKSADIRRQVAYSQHVAKKRKHIDLKVKDLYWIIGRKSPASLESKVFLYKTIIKPIWTYGIELWGCPSKSHIAKMQRS